MRQVPSKVIRGIIVGEILVVSSGTGFQPVMTGKMPVPPQEGTSPPLHY